MGRKEDIYAAALNLFARNGFRATTTAAVAREAGVAEGLIFHHFQSKSGILMAILNEVADDFLGQAEKAIEKSVSGLDAIESIVRLHFRFHEKRLLEFTVLMQELPWEMNRSGSPAAEAMRRRLSGLLSRMSECIEEGVRDGSIRADLDPEDTALVIHSLVTGLIRTIREIPGLKVNPGIEDQTFTFLRAALLPGRHGDNANRPGP
ncbi:MAG: TetR/AcrR family transcriptional regulator [Thermodesulfobacteriota bacterium]